MANFQPAFLATLFEEIGDDPSGAYSNDPDDAGGETKWGISKSAYPYLDIKTLTRDQAQAIYLKDFWIPQRCGDIQSQLVAGKLFDMSVNLGPQIAAQIVQIAIGVRADGVVGAVTVDALNAGFSDSAVMTTIRKLEMQRYVHIVVLNPKQLRFLEDWTWRVFAI